MPSKSHAATAVAGASKVSILALAGVGTLLGFVAVMVVRNLPSSSSPAPAVESADAQGGPAPTARARPLRSGSGEIRSDPDAFWPNLGLPAPPEPGYNPPVRQAPTPPPPPMPAPARPRSEALAYNKAPAGRSALRISPPMAPTPDRSRGSISPPPSEPGRAYDPDRSGEAPADGPRRLLVRDDSGRPVVTRVYGEADGRLVVLLPDGQLGWVDGRSFTERPFRPLSIDEVAGSLRQGPYARFRVKTTEHYVILYQCSEGFAASSGNLLETLYKGLSEKFAGWGLDVHEAEFPLVAVIYDTEGSFRKHNQVEPEIQAYYNILTNRIVFYETDDREGTAPELAAIRKPQTIAHEGTHQILQNIGVQPRLAPWPLWLVEGLAEYCAPTFTKKNAQWAGIGKVNALHMATIKDIDEQRVLSRARGVALSPDAHRPTLADLVSRAELGPTEYAYAWALTHCLASRRSEMLLGYLKAMSRLSPLERRSSEEHLASFKGAFGPDLKKINKELVEHLQSLGNQYKPLPYYAVLYEQAIGGGAVRKAAMISQSPIMIQRWLAGLDSPDAPPGIWHSPAFTSRQQAIAAANRFIYDQ